MTKPTLGINIIASKSIRLFVLSALITQIEIICNPNDVRVIA